MTSEGIWSCGPRFPHRFTNISTSHSPIYQLGTRSRSRCSRPARLVREVPPRPPHHSQASGTARTLGNLRFYSEPTTVGKNVDRQVPSRSFYIAKCGNRWWGKRKQRFGIAWKRVFHATSDLTSPVGRQRKRWTDGLREDIDDDLNWREWRSLVSSAKAMHSMQST